MFTFESHVIMALQITNYKLSSTSRITFVVSLVRYIYLLGRFTGSSAIHSYTALVSISFSICTGVLPAIEMALGTAWVEGAGFCVSFEQL